MAKQLVRLWKRPSYDGKKFTFYFLYTDEQGRRRQKSLGHTDARKAERQRAQFERELVMGISEPTRITLSELLVDYLERTRTQIELSTAKAATYAMRDFIAAVGNIYADRITYKHCERFQQYSVDKGLSPSTVNTRIKLAKRIFSLAVKRHQLESNPFDGIRLLKVPQGLIRLLSEDEVGKLLKAAPNTMWMTRVLLAKTAGLRKGEVLNITIADVDFDKGKIIAQPKQASGHTWRWVVKDKDRRELPLVDVAVQLLINIQMGLPEGQPYLLVPPARYRHLMKLEADGKLTEEMRKCPDGNFGRNWQLICRKAGVTDVTFHDLRATCITEWLEQGMMPHEVQRLAGHASINTTMKYYVGIRESMLDRAREASVAALGQDSVANLLQVPKNGRNGKKGTAPTTAQALEPHRLTQTQATGL